MHSNHAQVRARVDRLLRQRILPAEYSRSATLRVDVWEVPGEPVPFSVARHEDYRPLAPGSWWGAPWGTTWMRLTGVVPSDWGVDERYRLEATIDLGFTHLRPGFQAEGLVHDPSGRVLKAVEPLNRAVALTAGPGDDVELWVEAASNPDLANAGPDDSWPFDPSPLGSLATAPADPLYRLGEVRLALRDTVVSELIRDITVLCGLLDHLPEDRPRHAQIIEALRQTTSVLDAADVRATAVAARAELAAVLSSPASASAHRILATGHAHIDSAWLWPVRETARKCARTFSNVLDLMDRHEEMVFACSSAQQLEWIRESYPDLFARILARVEEGRFVPVGGMWVESDTNMPSGESLVRQFVEGTAVFRDILGVEPQEVWLPDSFGYSAGLPQIAVSAGARWMLTQKMSWNDTNVMPHHTFWWEGIDGSRIFTHFPPADTYCSTMSLADLDRAERQFADKGPATMSLLPFGHGDGGGGPTREMLADARRLRDLEGAPRVEIVRPQEFFRRAEDEYGDRASTWFGEMYLELHRGVYTSQARTKLGNRRSEQLLHDAELWATTAAVRAGAEYPAERLRDLWRTVLLQQFHDILPGSSIAWVHEEAERNYAEVERQANEIVVRSRRTLMGEGETVLWVNSAPTRRGGAAPMSIAETRVEELGIMPRPTGDGGWMLDNGVLRVRIGRHGSIDSFMHPASGRDLFTGAAPGARPMLFPDMPSKWDAWDVDRLDRDRAVEVTGVTSIEVVERQGLAWLQVRREHGLSVIVQRYMLREDADSLDIEVEVDWQEREAMLKLAFPLDLHAETYAAQTQFGHVRRAVHTNTSWDAARFEACAHRFVHVAEGDLGVILANSRTYGHDVIREIVDGRALTTIRPTLLRAPEYPAPDADRGAHTFAFRLGLGGLRAAVAEGYALASAPVQLRGGCGVAPLVQARDDRVIIETVKCAQDGSGDVILRAYEPSGERTTGWIDLGFEVEGAWLTDVHEMGRDDVDRVDDALRLSFRAFEMVTLRLRPRS